MSRTYFTVRDHEAIKEYQFMPDHSNILTREPIIDVAASRTSRYPPFPLSTR